MRQRLWSQVRSSLVDSGAYFALLDRRDAHHREAQAIHDGLIDQRWQLFTTSFILAETHALLLNRSNLQVATQFLREMEQSPTTMVWVTQSGVEQAKQIIYQSHMRACACTPKD